MSAAERLTLVHLDQLAPRCLPAYLAAFEAQGASLLARYGIATSALRTAHFMAQVLHESAALTVQWENLRYSAARLPQVWPSRFKPGGPLDPAAYAYNERKLANAVYGGRMGNTAPDDGYLYRGRGLLQLTGRANYATALLRLRAQMPDAPDLLATPDVVLESPWCLAVATSEWAARGCNEAADQDDLALVTQCINGGKIGLEQRRDWLHRVVEVMGQA